MSKSQIRELAALSTQTGYIDDTTLDIVTHAAKTAYASLPPLPRVVCLCGSTKFKEQFIEENFHQTMAGNIVLTVGFFSHSDKKYVPTFYEKEKLDELHKRKIDLADEILVLNVGGYIGESTRSEIEYAERTGKDVRYLE